jgi:hypothetical protein
MQACLILDARPGIPQEDRELLKEALPVDGLSCRLVAFSC